MTTWTQSAEALVYPMAVMEWKSFNNLPARDRLNSKLATIERDRD
jgi:hypothetical protein